MPRSIWASESLCWQGTRLEIISASFKFYLIYTRMFTRSFKTNEMKPEIFIYPAVLGLLLFCSSLLPAQKSNTYCNPMNLGYAYSDTPGDASHEAYRSAADPTLVNSKGVYYLFATNQNGYWWSNDLISWNYVYNPLPPNESGDDMCAPAAWSKGDTLLLLNSTWVNPRVVGELDAVRVLGQPLEREYRLLDLLRRPQVGYESLMTLPGAGAPITDRQVVEQVEIQAKYQGYIDRQLEEVGKALASEETKIPETIDYARIGGLSNEIQQKLVRHRPQTIGQASRIQGMTPAAISILLVHLKRGELDAARQSA